MRRPERRHRLYKSRERPNRPPAQTVDKTNGFRQFDESFGQRACAFCQTSPSGYKETNFAIKTRQLGAGTARRGGAGGCLLALRRGRNFLKTAFSLANSRSDLRRACEPLALLLRLRCQKKAANEFSQAKRRGIGPSRTPVPTSSRAFGVQSAAEAPKGASAVLYRSNYTLKRKNTMSPSCITYSLPSLRISPASLTAFIEPYFCRS